MVNNTSYPILLSYDKLCLKQVTETGGHGNSTHEMSLSINKVQDNEN